MQIKKVLKNTRVYGLNGDYEAIWCSQSWGGTTVKNELLARSPRGESPDYETNRKRILKKARSKIRRLVKYYKFNSFVTLTFAENITDVKLADAEFRKFMKRVRRRFPEFKYVGVREFQDRGAIHYHLAVNMYLKQSELANLWGHGFVWVQRRVGNKDKLSNYLTKYIRKHSDDERLKGDSYFDSVDDLMRYLDTEFKDVKSNKRILYFDDQQIFWIG